MKFPGYDHYVTGTAVPVSALRSNESCGIGEFLDLIPFGSFCKKCGLEVIQILPINDTGVQSSPYSAVSAFALHPVYIRLQNLPGNEKIQSEITALQNRYNREDRVAFEEIVHEKLALCRTIFSNTYSGIERDEMFAAWLESNSWVKIYSVYKCYKIKNGEKSWVHWENVQNPTTADIEEFWNSNKEDTLFFAWLQFHLERQLKEVAETLGSIQIALKGDLPILMIEDSADVWMHRKYFILDKRAGAPPDMFSREGQNWGFPIYNWDRLGKEDFIWWRERLRQAAKIYHAFRIDHVLGFFRIWAVPDYEESASLGYYVPYNYISRTALEASGFSEERITWLSKAHIYGEEIRSSQDDNGEEIFPYLRQIEDEDLYCFSEEFRGGADIEELEISPAAKQAMKEWKKNRTLIQIDNDTFVNSWYFTESRGYESLRDHERREFHQIIDQTSKSSEKVWEKTGRKILAVLKNETDMLVCAEDLGVVPKCVPKVLGELDMLSLNIVFWTRKYDSPGEPFIPVNLYTFNSVATLSVHDSFVFRGWWEQFSSEEERIGICQAFGIDDAADKPYTPELAGKLIEGFFTSSSFLCILQIQDFFALDSSLQRSLEFERINTPGTVSKENWTYRIPEPIETLMDNDRLCSRIQKLTASRRNRPLP